MAASPARFMKLSESGDLYFRVKIPALSGRLIRQSEQERGNECGAMQPLGGTPSGIYRPELLVLC